MPSQKTRKKILANNTKKLRRDPPRITRNSKKDRTAHYSSAKMKDILIQKFGLQCWGCDFVAPRSQYLQLDHIAPKSEGGSNALDNRALLCPPCNALKSNTMTLTGLRQENYRKGFSKTEKHKIVITDAIKWAKLFLQGKK